MKLYWAPHTRAFRTLWMLEESGLPYELHRLSLDGDFLRSAEYRAINPMMKVPALEDGTVRIAESGAICAYLAERAPEARLAPAVGDPARGRYLQWMFFDAACMEAAFTEKLLTISLPSRSAGWGSFDRVMDAVEGLVSSGSWALGDQFTAVDVMLGSNLWYGIHLLKVVKDRPVLEAYCARCTERPAFLRAEAVEAREAGG